MSALPLSQFSIREFAPRDLGQVQELFSSGLIEFAGEHSQGVQRYIDRALTDDMADIAMHYQSHVGGNFWVVEYLDSVVGHVGIQPGGKKEEAELRRMSVSSHFRRYGAGRRLLETTENFCRSTGYDRIILSTVDFLKPALAMYQSNGYTLVKTEPYGVPPNDQLNIHYLVKELYSNN